MDWFRSWHGAPTDNKWLLIAKRAGVTPMMVSAVFWALLDYASQQEERGSVAGFDAETYAMWAGCDETDVIAIVNAMRAKGVITDGETLAAWEKRQPRREDDSSERVRRHRDKQRQSVTDDTVTQCNDTVTQCNAPDKSRLDQIRLETDGDSETDTELLAPNGVVPMAQTSIVSALTPSNGNGKHEKPKRERSDKQKELDDWISALAVALEFDAKIPGAYAKWTKIGKGYAAAGYVPADVLAWKETAWPLSWQYERGYKPSKNVLDDGLPEIRRKREKLESKSRPTPPKALGVVNIDGKRMQILKHADGREELKEIVEVTA
jgi:hypothetical protein